MTQLPPTVPVETAAEAYAWCERYGRDHYENFSVVSLLVPPELKQHFHAIYAFCRYTDDLGDEAEADRLALLNRWEEEIVNAWQPACARHPIAVALESTAARFGMEPDPFRRLIEANRMDQRMHEFPTYADLLFYCEHSANPVGHMVLALYGHHDARRKKLADATCTALQLTNFWQDIARDLAKGRVYIPLEDIERFGYTRADLEAHTVDRRFRALMAFEAERTRELYREGMKLLSLLEPRPRRQVELFARGGMAVLDKVESVGFDVFNRRPELSRLRKAAFILQGLLKVRLGLGAPAVAKAAR